MKTLFILTLLSLNTFAHDGLTIANSFQVDRAGSVFRGKEPQKLVSELKQMGITDVVIFKNETKDEVQKEITALQALKIRPHHIDFRWKEFNSMEEACGQVVDALTIIKKVRAKNGKVYFHCTMGEDRTGMLAGLFLMLEDTASMKTVFRQEMCKKHYSDGNPKKPYTVTSAIEKELTPLFVTLAQKIEKGEWDWSKLSKRSCKGLKVKPVAMKCRG